MNNPFSYCEESFADVQMLRYRLKDFEHLPLKKKLYVYCLAKATLFGRDITTDQFGKYNLKIRKTLEAIYVSYKGDRESADFKAMTEYLKRVWFSNGIYHHYGCDKFIPEFSEDFLRQALMGIDVACLPLRQGQTVKELHDEIAPVIFNPDVLPKRVDKTDGVDIVKSSACNYYENVSQAEVEHFYAAMSDKADGCPPSYGLNTKLVKHDGRIYEQVWKADGCYGEAIRHIVFWLRKASEYAENELQQKVIGLLIRYYESGDVRDFDSYSIEWLSEKDGLIDFINGFIEVYGDPLGIKGSWEGIVTYKDVEANSRTARICENAQWFEDHSPVDPRFKKKEVRGVTANVVCAAMLGGDEYPSSAIGINLPNADWIRAAHGSKSITIGNLTEAYNKSAEGNGFLDEFVDDSSMITLIRKYGDVCDDLHTDLHECLGHGSGQLLPGVQSDALKSYADTIEEARADLFGLYYIADAKLMELGLVPDGDAYKAQYYTYMLNGLLTQLRRITPGHNIEEAHMRNRALIAHWVIDNTTGVASLVRHDEKTYLRISDYVGLRAAFAKLLAEIQRIKSEGDYEAARQLVEKYAVRVDEGLLAEVHERYSRLGIAPYKGFINPRLTLVRNESGEVTDVNVDYTEKYSDQMLRYSREYATL